MDTSSRKYNSILFAAASAGLLGLNGAASAQLTNLKVVTDANPDYSDMESMVRSITHNWPTDKEKMWALFYWDHIARRQTNPIGVHGMSLTDPIRQYNDYGYMMCSTISGAKCSTWNYMGYPSKYYDISLHTVPEVWYDGAYHHYDNSLSVIYTLCDGETIAGIEDVGKTLGCAASGGKEEAGHVAIYHALNGTSPDGFLEGADTMRDLRHIGEDCFAPSVLKYRWYFSDQDRGHRYILNLREGEVYARHYQRQDKPSGKSETFKSDPDYFIPNGLDKKGNPIDPESANPRYRIRGNGIRTWKPVLTDDKLAGALYSATNVKAAAPSGLAAAQAGQPAEAVFKVQGGNVITSLQINAEFANAGDSAMSISTDNGLNWKEVWKGNGADVATVKLRDGVNGQYDVLVKVALAGQSAAPAQLKTIDFKTITAINAKTQPQLTLGKNTVYVGQGAQTESIVVWPDLQDGRYKPYIIEEKNIASVKEHIGYQGAIYQATEGEDGSLTFKIDSPTDMKSVTYGGRLYNRAPRSKITFEHSFDGGQKWETSYTLDSTDAPWDVIQYVTVDNVPTNTRSVLFRYTMSGPGGGTSSCSIYSVRMEANHALAAPSEGPVEVTFNWSERQKDYKLVERSHTQVVNKLPATYTINVGGHDHPIVNALTVNLAGARADVKPGYSDGSGNATEDVGGEKFVGTWATYGKNLLTGKKYTVSIPSSEQWDAGDPDGTKLTDGRVGSSYNGGTSYREGALWTNGQKPEIVVDMGEAQRIGAFRIHMHGYEGADAVKGEVKDEVEVFTSSDGNEYTSQGKFDFNLYWKDIPLNYMWTDEETFYAHNFLKKMDYKVEARFVKFVIDCKRFVDITEVQALDEVSFTPFELKVALPDPATNGQPAPNAGISPNAKKWKDGELPDDIGKPIER